MPDSGSELFVKLDSYGNYLSSAVYREGTAVDSARRQFGCAAADVVICHPPIHTPDALIVCVGDTRRGIIFGRGIAVREARRVQDKAVKFQGELDL